MSGRRAKAILYTCNQSPCPETAQIFQANLERIGIDVEIRQFDYVVALTKAGTKGEPFDALFTGFVGDYADPYDFINVLLEGSRIAKTNNQNYAYFDDPHFNRKMTEASRLEGADRWEAYAALDEDIARNAAPLAVYANGNKRSFFSERIGCQLYHPVYTMSLASLCIAE
jgi:ABC-type oligopeptide transport system substrate-binding subunit